MVQLKKQLQNLKKGGLSINEYVLKIKILTDDLESASCVVSEEEKLMYVLRGLDESFDNIFSTITEKMIFEKLIVEYTKALLLSHESRIGRRPQANISSLPSINLSVSISSYTNKHVVQYSQNNKDQASSSQHIWLVCIS